MESDLGVGLGANEEGSLGGSKILVLAFPGLEARCLQGAAVGESKGPGVGRGKGEASHVHSVEVEGCLLLGLATGEELKRIELRYFEDWMSHGDTGHGSGDNSAEGANGVEGDLLGGVLLAGLGARGDHVWLEEGAFQEDTC